MFIDSQAYIVTRLRRRGARKPARCACVIYLGLGLAAAIGCAGQSSAPAAPHAARAANRYVYVTTQKLPGECYSDLGAVRIAQPYGEAAVDADNSAATREIRAAALGKYPADVDAV